VQDLAFESSDAVSLADCLDMAAGKTGALMSASAAIGAVLVGAGPETVQALSTFGAEAGIAFQLVDDLLGIWGQPETTGKPVFSDLVSRKKTLPVSYAIEHGDRAGRELRTWLARSAPPSADDLRHAAALVERAGGRRWATEECVRRTQAAVDAVDSVPMPEHAREELLRLARFLASRDA
jgi:geranylgeranyl diphosphate synthase, type I